MINSDIRDKIEKFDIVGYLENNNIDFKFSSRNVLICCPFCGEAKFKAGILTPQGIWNCFKCNEKGNLIKLISKISSCSFFDAKNIINCGASQKYEQVENLELEIEALLTKNIEDNNRINEVNIPPTISLKRLVSIQKRLFYNYLIKRNFCDINYLHDMGITACLSGYYKNRVIIPIYYKNEMVTFLSRDVTERAEAKYKNLPANKSILTVKEVLYGYDTCMYGDNIILVEGVFDWLRVNQAIGDIDGYSVLAVLGKTVTIAQQIILQKLNPGEIKIFFDEGTSEDSEKLKMSLLPFIDNVFIVDGLGDGKDPADCSKKEIVRLLGL